MNSREEKDIINAKITKEPHRKCLCVHHLKTCQEKSELRIFNKPCSKQHGLMETVHLC